MIHYKQQERVRTIALAAVMQTVHLVHNIANTGSVDSTTVLPLLNSILVTESDSTEAVYGGLGNLTLGFEQLSIQLNERKTKHQMNKFRSEFHKIFEIVSKPAEK